MAEAVAGRRRRGGAGSPFEPLILATCLAVGACYEPEFTDCSVECETSEDCAPPQVCGSDGFCAAPEHAGTCRDTTTGETGGVPDDDDSDDDDSDDDESDDDESGDEGKSTLLLVVDGRGKVVDASGAISCEVTDNHPRECAFEIDSGDHVALTAIDTHPAFDFVGWDGACGDEATCTVPVAHDVIVRATFARSTPE